MLSVRASLALLISMAVFASPALATTHSAHKTPTSGHARSTHHSSKAAHKKLHGQQVIDPARAAEIQQALIREHYMTGGASGKWDATTVAAMQKFQGDQGWQTKLMPDSRALKRLGLGPDYSHAINASGASFSDPQTANNIPVAQAAGFAAASGVNQ